MDIKKDIQNQIKEHMEMCQGLFENPVLFSVLENICLICVDVFKNKGKIMLCGNGGSAADSQHIAAEFVNRFRRERQPLAAISLTTDTSVLTSISNDYGYKYTFSKQIIALGQSEDVLICISTSGNAENVIEAVTEAKKKGIKTVAFTGNSGGNLKDVADITVKVPSNNTARIQEAHIFIAHILCDLVEKILFEK